MRDVTGGRRGEVHPRQRRTCARTCPTRSWCGGSRRRRRAGVPRAVARYGPVVWAVCRRLLRNHHDAEDAFQATLLVFVAAEGRRPARRGRGRRVAARGRVPRGFARAPSAPGAEPDGSGTGRRPARRRARRTHRARGRSLRCTRNSPGCPKSTAPCSCCAASKGLSRDEAATRSVGPSTGQARPRTGRELLRSRLARGIVLGRVRCSPGARSPAAAVPPPLVEAAVRHATGTAPPVAVSFLANGVTRTMWIAKWKWAVVRARRSC